MTRALPTLTEAKRQAKTLRQDRAAEGHPISHAQALEALAHQYGFRDWNGFHAAIRPLVPEAWRVGARVSGAYLSHRFVATVLTVQEQRPGWFRLVLDLDKAVDVVQFDSFSNLRKRVRAVVGPDGRSLERTSDGTPHMVLDAEPPET